MLTDKLCYFLSGFLAEFINTKFKERIPNTQILPVRSVRGYNCFNVPIDKLPLLKVYRLQEIYRYGSHHYEVDIRAEYHIPFPVIEQLPAILPFVSEHLALGFMSYENSYKYNFPKAKTQIKVEYNYQAGEAYKEIVHALTADFKLEKLPYDYLET